MKIVRISDRRPATPNTHCRIGKVTMKLRERECPKGHVWIGENDGCPFCSPEIHSLSEFGEAFGSAPEKTVILTRTGSYDAETLCALEQSHKVLMESLDEILPFSCKEIIKTAKMVRQKAGLL